MTKKRTGLLKNDILKPEQPFDLATSNIEPLSIPKNKDNKSKKYSNVRLSEELKISLDDLSKVLGNKYFYETVEEIYNYYVSNALSDSQKRALKTFQSLRDE